MRLPVRIGTRGSPLALAQATEVADRLRAAHGPALADPEAVAIVPIRTTGDRIRDRPLAEIGGKALFTKEIEEALLAGTVDLAVHSMKDVPTLLPEGLAIAAILPRADPRDLLIAAGAEGLVDLPPGARLGTSSLRRRALALAARPDLTVVPLRGNVDTRLARVAVGAVDATLLAAAGLQRLGRADIRATPLDPATMLPAPAQGAIGVQIRSGDAEARRAVAPLHCAASGARVAAERGFLAALDGSCRTPIAALAVLDAGTLRLDGLVAAPDGASVMRAAAGPVGAPTESVARVLGEQAGAALRARLPAGFLAA